VTTAVTERLAPRILARPEHTISRRNISTEALKVLYRLHRSGYQAYLVGGAVRDLQLGVQPKDFDIGTNARPQEVRRLFRNSRIIGRRFRLVHVFFKNEIVEVATFRASPEPPEGPDDWEEAEAEAMEEQAANGGARSAPVDAGIFGTPAEDARRRDFTVNALFYDIADFSILDYVGGIDDLEARLIRTIGDPDVRYQEDPVRMMRALEYGIRLGFEVEEQTMAAIDRCRDLIREASPARLTYELLESLRSGSAAGICRAWQRSGVFGCAFPDLEIDRLPTTPVLDVLDRSVASGARCHDAALIGALFLPRVFDLLRSMTADDGRLDNSEFLVRLHAMLDPAAAAMHLSNHTLHLMHHALFTLTKMRRPPERGRQVLKLCRQEYFPVVWDLQRFAAEAGLARRDVHAAWSRAVDRVRRGETANLVEERSAAGRRSRRRRPRRRRRK
jgi:poly(A) polymerase